MGAFARFRADVREVIDDYGVRTSPAHKRFVLFLLLAGTVLRAWMLSRPVSYDEAFAYVAFATRPIGTILSDHSHPTNHILHTLLAKLSTGIFGVGQVSLRLPAFFAGVLSMPLFYLFARGMFNRYIAIMALALVASSGGLIEYGALAYGYSLTWLCMTIALVLGRHFVKENNAVTALLIGLFCALGAWAMPSMIFIAAMIHLWLFFSLMFKYDQSLRARLTKLLLSLVVFVLLTLVFYTPVIMAHGLDQLFQQAAPPEHTWQRFTRTHTDQVLNVWVFFTDPVAPWIGLLAIAGLFHAFYISSKYRMLVFAMALGAIPLVMLLSDFGHARTWLYTLYIFHLSSAIAIFYLLKFVQDKLIPGFGKRARTAGACLVLLLPAVPAMPVIRDRLERFPEAQKAADHLARALKPGDHVLADVGWEAPMAFYLIDRDVSMGVIGGAPTKGHFAYVAVDRQGGGSFDLVLGHHELDPAAFAPPVRVEQWQRMDLFAARYKGN